MNSKQPDTITRIRQHKIFAPLRGQGLKALVLKGAVWTIAGFGGQKVLQFGSSLILTRILFPEAFGIMSLLTVFLVALGMFSDLGIKPAIIQHKRGEDFDFLNTAWTIQIIRGFILWLIACLIAWPLAQLYDQQILFPILCFIGVTAAINGFQSTTLATQNRSIQLGRLTLIPLIAQIIAAVITVLLAWIYESVWALAVGSVVSAIVNTILSHLLLPFHRHRIHIERQALGELMTFGKWIFFTTVITYFYGQGIRAIQGVLITPEDLGILHIAGMIAWAIGDLAYRLTSIVGFPALAQIAREKPHRLQNVLAKIRLRFFLMTLPAFIMLSLLSKYLIDFLYDDRYAAGGAYLAIMALNGAFAILPIGYTDAFLATGNSRTPFAIGVVSFICRVGGLFLGYQWGGILGMLAGLGAGTLLIYFYVLFLANRSRWLSPAQDFISLCVVFGGVALVYSLNYTTGG